jgi:hypothetical protein
MLNVSFVTIAWCILRFDMFAVWLLSQIAVPFSSTCWLRYPYHTTVPLIFISFVQSSLMAQALWNISPLQISAVVPYPHLFVSEIGAESNSKLIWKLCCLPRFFLLYTLMTKKKQFRSSAHVSNLTPIVMFTRLSTVHWIFLHTMSFAHFNLIQETSVIWIEYGENSTWSNIPKT